MKIYSFLIIVFICSFGRLYGQLSKPKYANEFLSIGVGARAMAMGNAVVSSTSDASSIYWNPAKLTSLKSENNLLIQHSEYFAGIASYDYLAFAKPLDSSSIIGVSLLRFGVDDIPDTRFLYDANGAINYDNITFFSAADYAFQFSYARKLSFLENLSFGANTKIIYRKVGQFANAWGFGLDAAITYPYKNFNFSIVGKDVLGTFTTWYHNVTLIEETYLQTDNIIPKNTTEMTLPRMIIGASYKVELPYHLSALGEVNIETTFDGPRNTYVSEEMYSMDPKFGIELAYKQIAYLRFGGNNLQRIKNFDGSERWNGQANFGLGFRYSSLKIDYAYTDIGNASESLYSHVFTLILSWDGKK